MTIWQTAFVVFTLIVGYLAGFQHGGDRVSRNLVLASAPVEVTVASPFASACATMLEAAWAIEDAPLTP